ncbi:hypothetical protein [Jiangella alkaliphila]|uniref:Uncharacterized protein n=1 Tax=Jiangella alkaliphila TaxID=419479 RepID=A0A1H2LL38_9ACTN|nr:hypothetical protein [Jiangella alkaliphila]SDU81465.1 hypothetical protein SAMN04488563_6325 [Jiangella alkaliphila]
MPVPYVEECNTSMSLVRTAAGDIEEAIQVVRDLLGTETWTGSQATAWETEFDGFATPATNSLGTPLDEAIQTCRDNAAEWQAESAGTGAR